MRRSTPKQPVLVRDLFTVYRERLRPPESSVVRVALTVINRHSPVEITEAMVTYTVATRTLSIHTPSLLKQRLCVMEPAILAELERELGAQSCPRALV